MDLAYDQTERALQNLEKKIAVLYSRAAAELQVKIDAYFGNLIARDERQRKLMEDGQITKEQYQLWRLAQIGRGERFVALQEEIARRCNEANVTAVAYVNDTTPGIYSLNHNYSAYTIEKVHGNVGFTLLNEQAVRRLLVDDPELLPAPRVDIPADLRWNKQKLQRELVSGIMQGESIGKIADRFQSITDMNRVSALRNARTAVTGAQNAGRQKSYDRAAEMGIHKRKRWRSVKDGRTRHSHGMLDSKTVDADDFFVSELGSKMLYPGDRDHGAVPADLYNCRCGVQLVEEDGIEAEPRMMRVRNPVTGRNELVSEMSYQEWYDWKRSQDPQTFDLALKKTANAATDQKQHTKYRKLLGKNVPKTFADFQDLKYNNPEKWRYMKLDYKRRNELRYHPELTLPGAASAVAPEPKFTKYLFDPESKNGWPKGQAFISRLGYSIDNWQALQREILRGAQRYPAEFKGNNGYGDKYEQKMILYGTTEKPANVIVGWILKSDGCVSLTSAYIKEV